MRHLLTDIEMNLLQRNALWIRLCLLLLATCVYSIHSFASTNDPNLINKIAQIEKRYHVTIGVKAIHIENNKTFSHHGNQKFFMASTVKLPIALTFLHRVDLKQDSLNRKIPLSVQNSVPGSGHLYHRFERRTQKLSSQQLLQYMLIESDNSASDTILKTVNGPKMVTKRMEELGFKHIVVNRSILEIMTDTNHVDHAYLDKPRTVYGWKKLFNATPIYQKILGWRHFQNDNRDTTTPDEMAELLVKLQNNQALSKDKTKLLLGIMGQCRTGRSRIRALLPPQAKVAHKTGTWGIDEQRTNNYPGAKNLYRFASDVGIITLPKNKGHIAIAVYVKSQSVSDFPRSRSIALVSRAIYDNFMK